MRPVSEFSKDEKSLLLFFETCAVDHSGYGNSAHMNSDDLNIATSWGLDGYLQFGLLKKQYRKSRLDFWVGLSERALKDAGELRKMRAEFNRPAMTPDMFEE